ncbi:putative E3 ubiquitin-protein ligase XBAT34 isoform X2 [Humulus lupulus]|uniref:putative E3 ubiquitin-protein ligase XBAT34 isoform X2 n=1 Tax=Humulus lupulus TaxID=3486 RepID=UPI002B40F4D9|nr:putative E3 ubiquitin-protein ligase XBAT34 isoform X2 [Humulus lupulus]
MGQQQSKDELLYQQVSYGNTEGIKSLFREGARLEWVDRDGKTPLMVASMIPELYNVAKTLIELGANVNAYRAGRHAGTPLHHAAKRGLENTVKLLLTNGANALVMNDDCQTPLDVARDKGHGNVVRAIEHHIRLFSGWMREFYGPGFLEAFVPQLLLRKVWVVILPSGSRNPTKPYKLELALYPSVQDAKPRAVIALWKANLEEPKSLQTDPFVSILENFTKTRIKLAPEKEGDWQQLQQFCNACKGIPQAHPAFLHNDQPTIEPASSPSAEDLELAMALSASIQSAPQENPFNANMSSGASSSCAQNISLNPSSSNQGASKASSSNQGASKAPAPLETIEWPEQGTSESSHSCSTEHDQIEHESAVPTNQPQDGIASAPPIPDGPIYYPSIDSSPVDISSSVVEGVPAKVGDSKEDGDSSSCVVCLDSPVEGACIPCGHMAGCMSCLNEIKAKKWGCPVCRAKIDQVVKLYAV